VLIPFLLSAYFGAAALALALAGLRRDRLALLGAALFLGGALLSLGTHFLFGPLLEQVPPFSFFRYPEKYLLLAAFGWSMLVAAGVQAVEQGAVSRRGTALAFGAAAVALGALLLTGPLVGVLEGWIQLAIDRLRLPVEGAVASVREAATHALAFALLAALIIAVRGRLRGNLAPWLLVVLFAVDLWLVAQRTIWTGPISLYRDRPELPQQLAAAATQKPFRFWRDNARLERWVQSSGTYEGMAERRAFDAMSLKTGIGAVWGVEDLGNPSPVVLARWRALTSAPGAEKARPLALYNVCAVIASRQSPITQAPALRPLFELPFDAAAFALEGCVSRLSFARRVRVVATMEDAVRAVLEPTFVPGEDAVVEGPRAPLAIDARVVDAAFARSGAVEARLEAPDGGLLVYATTWFPGWQATVDGQPAALLPVDGALIGIEVPRGGRELKLEFVPRHLVLALVLSALGVVVLLTLCAAKPLSGLVSRK
jgi:hypothetical protein